MAVLEVAEVKDYLNITVGTYDAELADMIDAAEAAIAKRVGPLSSTAVTTQLAGGSTLVLPVYPVLSLTTVTDSYGGVLVVGGITVESATGVLSYTTSGNSFTAPYYTVTYQAGRATVPADLLLAVKELVKHLWESQRSPARFPGSTISDGPASTPGAAYLLPYRVQELLAPHQQFGFA